MPLHKLAEGVCVLGAEQVHDDEHPVIQDGCMLRQEPVKPQLVATKGLHDLKATAGQGAHTTSEHTCAQVLPLSTQPRLAETHSPI